MSDVFKAEAVVLLRSSPDDQWTRPIYRVRNGPSLESSGIFVMYVSSDVITIASTEHLFVNDGCSCEQV